LETFKLLPGIKTGDLGPKFGYGAKDNGWAIFNKVRIPRTDMLMGFCKVSKDGEFSIEGDLLIDYQTHMNIYGPMLARAFSIQFTGLYLNE